MNKKAFDKYARKVIETGVERVHYDAQGNQTGRYVKGNGMVDLTQERADDIKRCLEDVRPLPIRPGPVISIILEETEDYFSGAKSMEEVIDVLQNRVQLYLNEQVKKK